MPHHSHEPAVAGSYGHAPGGFRLPEDIHLGPVKLQVSHLQRSLEYYQNVIGLTLLTQEGRHAVLGAPPGIALVELHEHAGARRSPDRGQTGLFHFAILLPDRAALGRFAAHLQHTGQRAGSADHFVSEAFYLQDPDNLGIEVYADRPRDTWKRRGRELVMGTEPIDLQGILQEGEGLPWTGIPKGTVMGHMHLHVGDLGRAASFYSETLGFDRMVEGYPGALFMGAGGYHHHLGTNTWAGRQATPPSPDHAQLLEWTLELPNAESLSAAVVSLGEEQAEWKRTDSPPNRDGVLVRDPWGTAVRLVAPSAEAT